MMGWASALRKDSEMTKDKKAELLDWIAEQDRLRIETWNYMGGRKATSVWTIFDDEGTPSGKAPTVIEALAMAKQAQEHEATRRGPTPP